MFYIIKIKGKVNIPDYVQLRDEKLTLLAYFRLDRPDKALQKAGFEKQIPEIINVLNNIPFGKLHPIELDKA